jgi:hypothetical protein
LRTAFFTGVFLLAVDLLTDVFFGY